MICAPLVQISLSWKTNEQNVNLKTYKNNARTRSMGNAVSSEQ